MAKAQVAAAARFMTEVAPPPVVSVMRRRKKAPRSLDTIAEDDREQLVAASPSDYGIAAAWMLKRMTTTTQPLPRERAGGFMTTSKYAHGCQQASGGWEGGHKLGHRRAVHAQELHLHKVGA